MSVLQDLPGIMYMSIFIVIKQCSAFSVTFATGKDVFSRKYCSENTNHV